MLNALTDVLLTSEVSRICGVSAQTVRLWERRGILPASKTDNGVRLFRRDDVERVAAARAASRKACGPASGADGYGAAAFGKERER